MRVGMCYESVLPARGGCEHYIGDLARRLSRDGHEVHLFACRWDATSLPADTRFHQLPTPRGPRFLRPWRFAQSCVDALRTNPVDVSMGFDKTWGQDILYPQGGLHSASRDHNLLKHSSGWVRLGVRLVRLFDPTTYSFARLERKQYLSTPRPAIIVNSHMVQRHFAEHLGLGPDAVRVLYSAIDPDRFRCSDRGEARRRERKSWGIVDEVPVGLFVAMNYRLKGLAPLIRSLVHVPRDNPVRIVVVGNARYSAYEKLAQSLGVRDRIVFLGFRADPRDAYFAADYLVHPTFYDPCSLVALEALVCGLPVVTTQYNGAHELLTPPRDGLVVRDPHDAKELGQAIADMADRDRLAERQKAAAATGLKWTFDDHYRDLLSLFQEIVSRRST